VSRCGNPRAKRGGDARRLPRRCAVAALAAALLAAPPAIAPARAAPPPAPLEQEFWAGISYGDALLGLAILGGSGVVIAWVTGSAATGLTVAAAAAAAYVAYDPGPVPPVTTPSEALPDRVALTGSP
jgi:hypothetical protein